MPYIRHEKGGIRMPRKKQQPQSVTDEVVEEWYTAGEAAKKLSETSGREIKPDYLFKLGHMDKVRTKKLSNRVTLYNKYDVDHYKVDTRRGRKPGTTHRESQAD
jgi:hypothetical protein